MKTEKIQSLPIILIVWNLIDIVVHIAVDMVEVLRVSGNLLAIAVAIVVLTGVTRHLAHDVLVVDTVLLGSINVMECQNQAITGE